MNFQRKITKKISFILIISILFFNFSFFSAPKKAEAQGIPTTDVWNIIWKTVLEPGINQAIKSAVRSLIINVTQATVNWINNGFAGNPAYPGSIDKWLNGSGGVVDQAVGDFFQNTPALSFLCEPFRVQVMLALDLGYRTGLKEQIGCTYTQVGENINRGIENRSLTVNVNGNIITTNVSNFADKGGWDNWLRQTMQPQNNPEGAYLIAKSTLDAKIKAKEGEVKLDITAGQGALTFRRCYDAYYSKYLENSGIVGRSIEYTEGVDRPAIPIGKGATQICKTKTPGATITAMLGMKATSDQRMNELLATLSNGIDNIVAALTNQLFKMAVNQLTGGVLDDSQATKDLNSQYNSALNGLTLDAGGKIQEGVDNFSSGNFDYAHPTIQDYTYTAPENNTSGGNTNGGTSYGGSALSKAKNNALSLINSLAKSESEYQNNYLTAQNILIEAQKVFASSSICNLLSNRATGIIRSNLIKVNVLTNIDGIPDSSRDLALIPWNLKVIDTILSSTSIKMGILDKAGAGVNSASTIQEVTDTMIPVNSNSFDSDSQSKLIENVKLWLAGTPEKPAGVQYMYNSDMCPIDLTEVLKIN